ncbi:type I-E CRISPR-associated protein Cas6/Cse3/CasE [Sphaerotilus mobilis]|uniref:CRISPR-associated Cse3 family protein n=1 Tax=Sphaerotilus mobilis TaxID=47994 RepID=A0A4Q7LGZ9_9BURK|nr:type I-E CRISPR-associated protein Cas6/Cse3/CasE [Sphaerotilus mobilis]RZS52987.1 CRISPR-associated Cse3 family protein [Sphaerotilus mobilis]
MYLSRLRLNPADPNARRDLADAYQMHRTLARVYAPDAEHPPLRFLWRQERSADGWPDGTVLVQAAHAGRWRALEETWPDYLQSIEADKRVDLTTLVRPGRRYRFRLQANPTLTRDGKRHGLVQEEAQLDWLGRQGQRHGFEVVAAVRGASERVNARHKGQQRIVVQSVTFDGVMQAGAGDAEVEALRLALLQGLGHAKSLGLGLLSLAPVSG